MRKFDAGMFVAAVAVVLAAVGRAPAEASFKVPPIAAGVMLPDGLTFVVSVPAKATLIYFDTTADAETKRVEVEFKPAFMAAQGKNLFVVAKGSGTIHVLEADTGKDLKTIKVPGDEIIALACHPAKGLLYSANSSSEVFAIDTETGDASKTEAKGQLLAVDPKDGEFVYTGIQKPIKERLVIHGRPGGTATITLAKINLRAAMTKYKVDGKDLSLEAVNDNAAINGNSLAVSRDGKQIAMAGGGGWRSMTDEKYHYVIACFDTSDMTTQLGQVEAGQYPDGIAFHPVLDLGAAYHSAAAMEVLVFKTKSYVTKDTYDVGTENATPIIGPGLLTFGGRGTKVVWATMPTPIPGAPPGTGDSEIKFLRLKLTDEDKEALEKIYGK